MRFKTTHAPPGDTLVHAGDLISALYFISRGSIEILKEDVVLAILGKNDIFGEPINPYDLPGKSSADVKALTYCDLHTIQRQDMLEVLDIYPKFCEYFWSNLDITFNLRDVNNESGGLLGGDDCDGFNRPYKHKISSTHTGENITTGRQSAVYRCRRKPNNWELWGDWNKNDYKHTLYDTVFSSEGDKEDSEITGPLQNAISATVTSTTRCLETEWREKTNNSITEVSDIFTLWGAESREDQRHQKVSHSLSLNSQPPTQPASQRIACLRSSSPCSSSPTPHFSPPSVISWRKKTDLQNRLEELQHQISKLESRMSADIGIIMQLLQRQMPTIPPSYSTLTSTPNEPFSPILSSTASRTGTPTPSYPTEKSSATNPQQPNVSQDQALQLLESNSFSCESSDNHTDLPPLIDTSSLQSSLYQSLFSAPSFPQNPFMSPTHSQNSSHSSSSSLPQTAQAWP
ncbi:potassium voltage-gated channel subfamily H member 2-like [Amphiprion ocellaris]|uniref:potassium voltage-gated channel subfamily H member 2-like n=1 Tax=Amphiprion ocellaris TaxID=80972 RepID=UPI0024116A87|nr:potassium voltage-gated channel subfamily H member 2-like [Amphiprion ocellaris]